MFWRENGSGLTTLSRMLQSECNIGNFSQLVTEPTRSQFNSIKGITDISCIDHVYTNYKFRCSKVIVEVFGASDHDLLGYTRFSKDPPAPAKTIRKRTYKNFNSDAFLAELRQADWSAVYQCQDVAWAEFKKLRNKVNNRRKFEEKNFKKEKVNNSLHSPTETWKTAKSFMDWESSSGPPSQLSVNGKLVTKASEIATEMNNFFMEKVRLIREGISFIPNRFIKCLEIMQNKTCKLSMKHVSISKVNKLLKKLKNSKSTSIDELDNFCVKVAADVIAEPLHHIITQSILQQKFPTLWKYSKVIPLHKKESKLERKNYRPVAILSPLSKILEKIIYEQMYEYFTKNKSFHPSLHGYRQHRSTQTALLSMYDRWVRNAAKGQVSGAILLDLSAAFDLVEPELLLKKLRIYGFEKNYLSWIESYLSNRL